MTTNFHSKIVVKFVSFNNTKQFSSVQFNSGNECNYISFLNSYTVQFTNKHEDLY